MADDLTAVLQELANLLRRRIEQGDAMTARAAEMAARTAERFDRVNRLELPNFARFSEEHDAMLAKQREAAERVAAENREFRERLLTLVDRQNALLERLLERLG